MRISQKMYGGKAQECAYMDTQIDGIRINYRDEGQGPLLVMLHGWGSNIELFDGIIRFAAAGYHVVAMDLPGFGKSGDPQSPWDVDDYVRFVLSFIKKICPRDRQIIFLGHSMGGRIIIKLAAQLDAYHPGFTIPKVILTDSAGIMPVRTREQEKRTKRYHFYKNLIMKSGILKLDPEALNKLQKKFGSADYSAASPVMRASLVKVVNEDLAPYMPKVNMPALLVWGDKDTATPLSDGQQMEKLMPEAGLAVIEGAGHYSFLDNPVLYQRILGSFLQIKL